MGVALNALVALLLGIYAWRRPASQPTSLRDPSVSRRGIVIEFDEGRARFLSRGIDFAVPRQDLRRFAKTPGPAEKPIILANVRKRFA